MPGPDIPLAARERLAARARSISLIRRRVAAAALATFALAWGVVLHDGSMGATTTAPATQTTASSPAGSSTDSSGAADAADAADAAGATGASDASDASGSSDSSDSTDEPAAVTTAQS